MYNAKIYYRLTKLQNKIKTTNFFFLKRKKMYLCIMKKYGLIGCRLSHSWSQQWFEEMFRRECITDASYQLFELDSVNDLPCWAAENRLSGFNVTIPYKEAAVNHLDDVDSAARAIGAVNCVARCGSRLIGHNTDAPAFAETLRPLLAPEHRHALVLGTGGAAKAVVYALRQLGISATMVSRQPKLHPGSVSYAEAVALSQSHLLIVNATPVGMYPNVHNSPWPDFSCIGAQHLCYDLIYNPSPTLFLSRAAQQGAATCGGLAMLYRQAELSWDIWQSNA